MTSEDTHNKTGVFRSSMYSDFFLVACEREQLTRSHLSKSFQNCSYKVDTVGIKWYQIQSLQPRHWPSVGDMSANALAIAWAKALLGLDLLLIY